MNKSLLTIGIVLSLGSFGCAGFGFQQSSSLAGSYRAERGVDDLWVAEGPPPSGAETPLYAEQTLGTLWGADADPAHDVDGKLGANRGSDLWNPASPGYPQAADTKAPQRRSGLFSDTGSRLTF